MIWLALFVVAGGTYVAVDRLVTPGFVGAAVFGLAFAAVATPIIWLEEKSGLLNAIVNVWRFMAGTPDGAPSAFGKCPPGTVDNLWGLLNIIVVIVVTLGVLILLLSIPVAIVLLLGGIFDEDWLRYGGITTACIVGGIILAGFGYRLMWFISTDLGCT